MTKLTGRRKGDIAREKALQAYEAGLHLKSRKLKRALVPKN